MSEESVEKVAGAVFERRSAEEMEVILSSKKDDELRSWETEGYIYEGSCQRVPRLSAAIVTYASVDGADGMNGTDVGRAWDALLDIGR